MSVTYEPEVRKQIHVAPPKKWRNRYYVPEGRWCTQGNQLFGSGYYWSNKIHPSYEVAEQHGIEWENQPLGDGTAKDYGYRYVETCEIKD